MAIHSVDVKSPELFTAWDNGGKDQAERIIAESRDIAAEIDGKNNWTDAQDGMSDELRELFMSFAAQSMRELLTFCVPKPPTCFKEVMQVTMRFFCVVWLLRPELLGGETLSSLGRLFCGSSPAFSRSHLSQIASAASRRWHYKARVQRDEAARENHAEAARQSWPIRKANEARAASEALLRQVRAAEGLS